MPSTRALIFANAVVRAVDVSSAKGANPQSVRRSELVERNVFRCFQDAVAYLFGRLDRRVDRVGDSDEDPLSGSQVRADRLEHRRSVGLAGQLQVEPSRIQVEQPRHECGVVDVGAVRRVLVASGAAVNADPLLLFGRETTEDGVVQVEELAEQPARRVELQRQSRLREVDLHAVGAVFERSPDVGLGLVDEIGEELLA